MAKSVLELAVGTGQWNAGLKKAKAALDNFTQANGGLSQALDREGQKMQKFVKMMGSLDSTAKTARGQMNEYKSSIEQLTMQYNRMSDAQKNVFGQSYLQAIEQLKEKYRAVNDEIQEMNRSLGNTKTPVVSTGGSDGLSSMMSVFGGNLMTRGVETGISAAKSLAVSMKDTVQQGVELSKSAEGIRLAFERINRPDLLDKLKEATHGTVSELELMRQAVKFKDFNLNLDEMGTLLAFAQQKAKDTGQSVDYMVDSIVTGLGRQSLMILDNLGLSATAVKEKMKETGDMTSAVAAIIKEQMADAGGYVETAADRGAKSIADLENATLHLGDSFRETFGYEGIDEMSTVMETRLIQDFTKLIQSVDTLSSALSSMGIKGNRVLNALADTAYALMTGPLGVLLPLISDSSKTYAANGGTAGTGGHIIERHEPTKPVVTPKKRGGGGKRTTKVGGGQEVFPDGSIAALNEEIKNLQKQQQLVTDTKGWNRLQEAIDGVTKRINAIKGVEETIDFDKMFPMKQETTSSKSIGEKMTEGIIGDIAGSIQDADTSTLKNLLQVVIENGLQGIDIPTDSIMEQILGDGADIPDEYWQKLQDEINAKLQELGIEPIKIDFKTGNITKDGEKAKDSWQDAAKAVQSVGAAMQNIEDPAAKVAGTVLQAVANVALGYANALTMVKETGGPWGWIAFAATGLATMMTTISAIHSATGYAEGGMVKGNSYSGDNLQAMIDGGAGGFAGLNSGEIVLNRAAQGNLASQLEGTGANTHLSASVSGEQILLVANRTTRRQGKGELVTWR